MDCIFCKLANKEIPTELIYEDENLVCFRDQNPQTELHLLFVPKLHVENYLELIGTEEYEEIMKSLGEAIQTLAPVYGFEENGFRLITNNGKGAGQSVMHLHFHLLSDPVKLRERLI